MKFTTSGRPIEILLPDLNMPRKNGREVSAEVKADDKLKQIPIIALTTSTAEQDVLNDVLNAYDLHANSDISKPVGFDQFANVGRAIDQFWFSP